MLVPRMTTAQRTAITSPATGLMVFDTNTGSFWYYSGSWRNMANDWSITGNAGTNPSTHFIGTTDNVPLRFRVANQPSGFISADTYITSFGYQSYQWASGGQRNVAIGTHTMQFNSTGSNNATVGFEALYLNTTGEYNAALGASALALNTTGSRNTAAGALAGLNNTVANDNTAVGAYALLQNKEGLSNTAIGSLSLMLCTSGDNTAVGYSSLYSNTTGTSNTAIGRLALFTNTIGHYNIGIGYGADVSANNLSNAIAIGNGAIVNASNKIRLGNGAITVIEGQVPFTTPSDGRFKYNVHEDVKGLDFILKLRPVTYQFDAKKLDDQLQGNKAGERREASNFIQASYQAASAIRRTGFIAQEVEDAAISSGYDFSGVIKPATPNDHYSLSYESFVVPLVKAVQELSKEVEELKAENKELKKMASAIEALQAEIKEIKGAGTKSK